MLDESLEFARSTGHGNISHPWPTSWPNLTYNEIVLLSPYINRKEAM